MEALDFIAAPAQQFTKNCINVLKRCSAPSAKILKRTALVSGVGFLIFGTVGFVFKLISIPVNNVIIGAMANQHP